MLNRGVRSIEQVGIFTKLENGPSAVILPLEMRIKAYLHYEEPRQTFHGKVPFALHV